MNSIKADNHDALNVAFAERVCGWKWKNDAGGAWFEETKLGDVRIQVGTTDIALIGLNFTRSADAVMPWLDKHLEAGGHFTFVGNPLGYSCRLYEPGDGLLPRPIIVQTPAHAMVIALLEKHGVTINEA